MIAVYDDVAGEGAQMTMMSQPNDAPAQRLGSRDCPLSVSQLIGGTNRMLEHRIGTFYVNGEVSSFSRSVSGHCYFSLADGQAQVRCVLWRSAAARLQFSLDNGVVITARGQLNVYKGDGKLQVVVESARPLGEGADALALEKLRQKLTAEGLFDPKRKRALPKLPQSIGVVTSKNGAALSDIVRAVTRRFPVPILLADARVQGADAPQQIAAALARLSRTNVDVIIVGRGGGSSGDLSAFNSELVVRAVAAARVPVIAAVGHEIDVSLTDLAADVRAATPTMAGEMATPVRSELREQSRALERQLARETTRIIRAAGQALDIQTDALAVQMNQRLWQGRQNLLRAERALAGFHPRASLAARRAALSAIGARLHHEGQRFVPSRRQTLDLQTHSLRRSMARILDGKRGAYEALIGRLDALSPLRVLDRGYAIAKHKDTVITHARQVSIGSRLDIRLARGGLQCRVEGHSDG